MEKYFPNNKIDVSRTVDTLNLADRQIVEICKTLMTDQLKVLVLDEPTSALSTDKAKQLHQAISELSSRGISVIYISHKLDEIKRVADRIVILRNGQVCNECIAKDTTNSELIQMLGGENTKRETGKQRTLFASEPVVKVEHLNTEILNDVNIVLNKGEILGISGLAGSGQTDLLKAIHRAHRKKGRMTKEGVQVFGSVAYIPGDRAREGIFPMWDIQDNTLIGNLDHVKGRLLLSRKKCRALALKWYDRLAFRAEGIHSNIMSLSGGNQQKTLIARGIASEADIIILNDPTAGVDIGTKQEIYVLLEEAKNSGKSMILYSTEDTEMEICDRVYIMHEGTVAEELSGDAITVPNIIKASFKNVEGKKQAENKESLFGRILSSRMTLPLMAMVLILLTNTLINPNILTYTGLRMKIGSTLPLTFAALGQMFIILSGDCDMGNGYSIGLVNVLVGIIMTKSLFVGIVSLLIFIGAYMSMAVLIHLRKIPAIVVTLGAQFVWYGIALILCPTPGGSAPRWLSRFLKMKVPMIPFPIIICIAAAFACWYLLFRNKYGMVLRGIGNNANSVKRSGWSYLLAKTINYGLAGFFIVLAGMAYTSTCNGADANSSVNYCMMSIATVILGGCAISGGVAVPAGVVAAAIAMNLINSLLTALKVDSNYQTAIIGLILVMVLAVKLLFHRKDSAQT